MTPDEPPPNQLDPRAIPLWRINAAAGVLPPLAGAAFAAFLLGRTDRLPPWVGPVLVAVAVAWAVWEVGPMPALRWRTWRYAIGEREVDLQRGWWTRTRTIVPMARIQHVDTARGPLQRRFGLASVVLYTAAGANEIPALDEATAAAAREKIAALANVREDL